ncbi:hypothetical protein ACIOHC_11415 [Streptomyces sp. NPDC088252]|uniref:hypothetical protein n=1 Tax=unclassified Streptomyces TaxID=2593676 RepID=UPI0038060714
MSAPMMPDRVRTDALQPGDRVWHPYDMVRFTVGGAPEELDQPLTFHNRATDETECGMRVTGTDDRGDAIHVDTAPSYLWHRDVEQPTAPAEEPSGDTSLTPEREREIRTLDLLELMSDRVAPVISGHLAALLAEVDRLRSERDAWHDWADSLAYKVAPVEVLGRHGEEGRFPWSDALDLITPAAEVDRLRARIAELESQPAPAAVLRGVADEWSAQCPEHSEADEVWMSCPGEWVYELHLAADAFEAGVRAEPAPVSPWERAVAGLNALVDAGVIFHVEPDGHISAPFSDEHIEWDLKARRWVLTHDNEDGAL